MSIPVNVPWALNLINKSPIVFMCVTATFHTDMCCFSDPVMMKEMVHNRYLPSLLMFLNVKGVFKLTVGSPGVRPFDCIQLKPKVWKVLCCPLCLQDCT